MELKGLCGRESVWFGHVGVTLKLERSQSRDEIRPCMFKCLVKKVFKLATSNPNPNPIPHLRDKVSCH